MLTHILTPVADAGDHNNNINPSHTSRAPRTRPPLYMSTLTPSKPWDFSHALELLNSNPSAPDEQLRQPAAQPPASPPKSNGSDEFHDSGIDEGVDKKDFAKKPTGGLGDFAKIWEYMGVPLHDVDLSKGTSPNDSGVVSIRDYTSDGATYLGPVAKKARGVTWKDQESADDTAGSITDHSTSLEAPKLTKTQRKKANRKERKEQERALAARQGALSENEAEGPLRTTPARKASAHGSSTPTKQHAPSPIPGFVRSNSSTAPLAISKNLLPASVTPRKKEDKVKPTKTDKDVPSTPRPKHLDATKRHLSQPATTTPVKNAQAAALYESYNQKPPLATPNFKSQQYGPPATTQANKKKDMSESISSQEEAARQAVQAAKAAMQTPSTPSKRPNAIEPRIIRSGEDKHWALFLRLLNEHPKERPYLVSPMPMVNHSNDPKGVHVFIDASNIFIGFNDQLKRERGIPVHWHTGNANISFDALALLMERRRPVAKRVLVGSFPEVPAFVTARKVGYEVSLLDKVYKAKELTERQIYFKEQDALRTGKRNSVKASVPVAPTRGSETTTGKEKEPQYAPAKMIEQGVDEILHLKILESIVDSEEPSTMVIATGDAAQAEYSDGFMAMAERALKKGWKVELVSWSANISKMYLRSAFREKWGEKFKTVFLDDFAEELLDM
ncbi:hypothetical protein Q7P37_006292 [Cladosporium fusiforme]